MYNICGTYIYMCVYMYRYVYMYNICGTYVCICIIFVVGLGNYNWAKCIQLKFVIRVVAGEIDIFYI